MEGGKPENPEENLRSRDKNQQQTQLTCDAGYRNGTRTTLAGGECLHFCTIPPTPTSPTLLPACFHTRDCCVLHHRQWPERCQVKLKWTTMSQTLECDDNDEMMMWSKLSNGEKYYSRKKSALIKFIHFEITNLHFPSKVSFLLSLPGCLETHRAERTKFHSNK